jgi:NarL family two-component system response regulator LiaR
MLVQLSLRHGEKVLSMTKSDRIRILIVDDHQLVRDGLRLLISTFDEFQIVGMAEDGEQAIKAFERWHPDVILMDLVMPNVDGPEATRTILKTDPSAKVIILTSFVDDEKVKAAMSAGAMGYLLKNASPEQLARAIRSAHNGMPTLDTQAVQALNKAPPESEISEFVLTARELDVLALIVDGKTNKDIASTLHISPTTVRDHVSQILSKLNVNNRTEAAMMASEKRLLSR